MEELTMDERAEDDFGQLLENRYYRTEELDRDILLGEIALRYATPRNTGYDWEDSRTFLRGKGYIVDDLGDDDFKVRGDDLEVFYNRIDTDHARWAASVNYWDEIPSEPLNPRDEALLAHLREEFKSSKTGDYREPERL